MKQMGIVFKIILLAMLWSVVSESWAKCQLVDYSTQKPFSGAGGLSSVTQTEDGHAAKIRVGNIQLMDTALQPEGTVLAQASVPPTEYKVLNTGAETILWACDSATTMSQIKFLTSVNGDDRVGGRWVVPPADVGGQTNVYYTWFRGVGIRQIMNGVTLAPQWTPLDLPDASVLAGSDTDFGIVNNHARCKTGWYCIRLKHLPILQFELIRIKDGSYPTKYSGTGGNSNQSHYCDTGGKTVSSTTLSPNDTTNVLYGLGEYGPYICDQPASYITLGHISGVGGHDGTGSLSGDTILDFGHDAVGVTHSDNASTYRFWGADNGFGYTLFNSVYLYKNNVGCKLNMVTPSVDFNSTTTGNLNSGNVVSRNFQVLVDCHNDVESTKSGVTSGKIAIGIQPSQLAYDAIKNNTSLRSLLYNGDTSQSVKALVDNHYGATGVAQNVGIYIKYQGAPDYITLLGQPGATGTLAVTTRDWAAKTCGAGKDEYCYPAVTYPQGNTAGWYPILNSGHYTEVGSGVFKTYRIDYTADLKKIDPAQSVTAGTINSTAYVVVKIQ
ncbi:fimbrial protein [Acinetobacter sp. VNK23]|uniref:fimbrial protein n=1 Tax=Acinetobacter thutiue TaxID=2998078 RepID=UPI0025777285|nr:fimbrial protein [Acinetobacter thutiue]MDM1019185.1 fimbrial protein [Acinetobacter thutiue]